MSRNVVAGHVYRGGQRPYYAACENISTPIAARQATTASARRMTMTMQW
jgi:hypothetical protein